MCLVAGGDPNSQTCHRNRLFSRMVNIFCTSLKLCSLTLSILPQCSTNVSCVVRWFVLSALCFEMPPSEKWVSIIQSCETFFYYLFFIVKIVSCNWQGNKFHLGSLFYSKCGFKKMQNYFYVIIHLCVDIKTQQGLFEL